MNSAMEISVHEDLEEETARREIELHDGGPNTIEYHENENEAENEDEIS